jgi:hypothetical protein
LMMMTTISRCSSTGSLDGKSHSWIPHLKYRQMCQLHRLATSLPTDEHRHAHCTERWTDLRASIQLCRTSGYHSGGYEGFFVLKYNIILAELVECKPTFRRNMSPPSSRSKKKPSKKLEWSTAYYLLHVSFLLGFFFDPKDGGDIFIRNVGWLLVGQTALSPRGQKSSSTELIMGTGNTTPDSQKSVTILTLYNPVVTVCTTSVNTPDLCILSTECIYFSQMILVTKSDSFPRQH